MHLDSLCVIHASKRDRNQALGLPELELGAFGFDSCQRRLWVTRRELLAGQSIAVDVFVGLEAYRFLLHVATGLESAVPGETDVFGQLKAAWRDYEARGASLYKDLAPWMQKIFEDTKDIRARHLENLGGASYGTLVRLWLGAQAGDRILILGAGQIVRSVAPYLAGFELELWNRTSSSAEALARELSREEGARVSVVSDLGAALGRATHVVVGIPLAPEHDGERVAAWRESDRARGRVLHLGALRGQASATWESLPNAGTLTDLFELRERQSGLRDERLNEARRACEERARLRNLGGALSVAHGWEDLAVFQ